MVQYLAETRRLRTSSAHGPDLNIGPQDFLQYPTNCISQTPQPSQVGQRTTSAPIYVGAYLIATNCAELTEIKRCVRSTTWAQPHLSVVSCLRLDPRVTVRVNTPDNAPASSSETVDRDLLEEVVATVLFIQSTN